MGGSGPVIFATVTAKIDGKFLRQIATFAGHDCSVVDSILCGSIGISGLSCRNAADGAWYVTGSLDSINKAHSHLLALYTLSQPTSIWDQESTNVMDLSPSMSLVSPLPGLLSPACPSSPPHGDPNTPQCVGYTRDVEDSSSGTDAAVDLRLTPRDVGGASDSELICDETLADVEPLHIQITTDEGAKKVKRGRRRGRPRLLENKPQQKLKTRKQGKPHKTIVRKPTLQKSVKNSSIDQSTKRKNAAINKISEPENHINFNENTVSFSGNPTSDVDTEDDSNKDADYRVEHPSKFGDGSMTKRQYFTRLKTREKVKKLSSKTSSEDDEPCHETPAVRDTNTDAPYDLSRPVLCRAKSRHRDQTFTCTVCGKQYTHASNLNRHVKVEHRGVRFTCGTCKANFTSKVTLVNHERATHSGPSCSKCHEVFADDAVKTAHACEKDGGMLKCDHCDKTFGGISNLKRHVRITHLNERYSCDRCSQKFCRHDSLEEHVWQVHNHFECFRCHTVLSTGAELVNHLAVRHGKIVRRGLRKINAQDVHLPEMVTRNGVLRSTAAYRRKESTCEKCGKKFSSSSNMNKHMKSVHENLRYFCPICGQSCATKERFYLHLGSCHTMSSFKCTMCTSEFRNRRLLAMHQRVSHGCLAIDGSYQCEICGQTFLYENNLRKHQRTLHGDSKVQCAHCNAEFASIEQLREHVRLVHDGELYHCIVCNRAFRTVNKCREHEIAKHTTLRPHTCTFCGASFARHSSLSYHLQHRHNTKYNIAGPQTVQNVAALAPVDDDAMQLAPVAIPTVLAMPTVFNRDLSVTDDYSNSSATLLATNPSSPQPTANITSSSPYTGDGVVANVTLSEIPNSNDNHNLTEIPDISSPPPLYLSMPVFLSLDSPVLWNLQQNANSPASLM